MGIVVKLASAPGESQSITCDSIMTNANTLQNFYFKGPGSFQEDHVFNKATGVQYQAPPPGSCGWTRRQTFEPDRLGNKGNSAKHGAMASKSPSRSRPPKPSGPKPLVSLPKTDKEFIETEKQV